MQPLTREAFTPEPITAGRYWTILWNCGSLAQREGSQRLFSNDRNMPPTGHRKARQGQLPDWTSEGISSPDSGRELGRTARSKRPSEPKCRTRRSYPARGARKSDPRFFFVFILASSRSSLDHRTQLNQAVEVVAGCHEPSIRPPARQLLPSMWSTAERAKTQTAPRKARGCPVYIKQQLDAFVTCHQMTIPHGYPLRGARLS